MSAGDILKNTIVPILGGIVATIMFASPSKAVFKARNRGTIGSLNPLPFVMAMANCVAWTTYGFLTDDWYLIIPNSLGCLIGTFLFLVSYGLGMPDKRSRDFLSLAFMVLALLLFVVTILERMVVTSLDTKKQLWGYTAISILVFYFLSPLSTLFHILKQRDSSSLVLALSVMNTVNGLLWASYGLFALSDAFVWAPNAFGAALGVIQVFLKLTIPSKENKKSQSDSYLPQHTSSHKQLTRNSHANDTNGRAGSTQNGINRNSAKTPKTPKSLPHLDTNLSTLDEQGMFMSSGSPIAETSEHRDHMNILWLPSPPRPQDQSLSTSCDDPDISDASCRGDGAAAVAESVF